MWLKKTRIQQYKVCHSEHGNSGGGREEGLEEEMVIEEANALFSMLFGNDVSKGLKATLRFPYGEVSLEEYEDQEEEEVLTTPKLILLALVFVDMSQARFGDTELRSWRARNDYFKPDSLGPLDLGA
ncbi:hypothetical protein Tco_1059026 [Tanacetum coccineum]